VSRCSIGHRGHATHGGRGVSTCLCGWSVAGDGACASECALAFTRMKAILRSECRPVSETFWPYRCAAHDSDFPNIKLRIMEGITGSSSLASPRMLDFALLRRSPGRAAH